jgi:hypothetical protein
MQEVTMSKTYIALAASALMLTCGAAMAQDAPSYESRGYGGPLYIGPNFHQGGQMAPPTYDSGSRSYERSTERYRAPQRLDRVQSRKRDSDDEDVKAAKKSEPAKQETAKSESENSSISVAADADKKPIDTPKTDTAKADSEKSANENSAIASVATTAKADPVKASVTKADTDGASVKPTGCKRYFPTIGQTLSVPCD